jgi:hypothetical protein
MRRRIGGPSADSSKQARVPFCTVCERFLRRQLANRDG